jgi:hypothetical protein
MAPLTVDLTGVLIELRIRQAQMLNLEVRFFVLILVSQLLFCALCAVAASPPKTRSLRDLGGAMAFTAIVLVGLGTNAKMGLSAAYLRQLEAFLESNGAVGVLWERQVMLGWVLVPGNAFTLVAIATACLFLCEFFWLWLQALANAISSRLAALSVAAVLTLGLAGLAAKAMTVDFGKPAPEFFQRK